VGFTRKLKYYLVHSCGFSNKQAQNIIENGRIKLNGITIIENLELTDDAEIELDEKTIRKRKAYKLIKYYKPVGKVSSLNPHVKDSLYEKFKDLLPLFIAGRLDKNSEGLLILTNHGKLVQELIHPDNLKQKTYEVAVDKELNETFLNNMRNGIEIMGKLTKPATCEQMSPFCFKIALTEGKNKQIRRMCKKQNYRVINLKRLSIDNYSLNSLKPDAFEMLNFD
jgi:23S rRNA pseudouridine2604 synthase